MFRPVTAYIGLRYTRARQRNHFISFIAFASMLGIALSLIVLITVLSVFNGFDEQIRHRIFTLVPHITITSTDGSLTGWPALEKRLLKQPGVVGVSPYVAGQGLVFSHGQTRPVIISGILPASEGQVAQLSKKMVSGKLSALKSGQFAAAIGDELAANLEVIPGDRVTLLVPPTTISPLGFEPRMRRLTVKGIFHVGSGFSFDNGVVFMNLSDAARLFSYPMNHVTGIQVKVNNLFAAPHIADLLQQQLGEHYQVNNWTEQYGAFYHAVKMEKSMMFLILILLVVIAVFNLLSGLVMAVNDKSSDIAILRTLGATPRMIMHIFVIQGTMIGLVGTILGLIGGLLLAANVTTVVEFIQNTFHVELFTSNVYFVNFLPSKIVAGDVIKVCGASLILSILATLYPARRAAAIQPAVALRYE
ncbi:MAG: lipoprotein-releasing ABC transporter permease subunit [Gammaproteobacteria bacterium]|nr:lipoprotein-releasing ABC transporter permease subunit [Gammaproteobacteria bacterium]